MTEIRYHIYRLAAWAQRWGLARARCWNCEDGWLRRRNVWSFHCPTCGEQIDAPDREAVR